MTEGQDEVPGPGPGPGPSPGSKPLGAGSALGPRPGPGGESGSDGECDGTGRPGEPGPGDEQRRRDLWTELPPGGQQGAGPGPRPPPRRWVPHSPTRGCLVLLGLVLPKPTLAYLVLLLSSTGLPSPISILHGSAKST